jgi:hypothetical protein
VQGDGADYPDGLEDPPVPVLPLDDDSAVGVVGFGDALDGDDEVDRLGQD